MKKEFYKTKNSGYIALISTIIISAVLIGLTSMVSQSSFFSRFDSLNGEYKRISKGMAESCVNLALLEVAQNPNTPSVVDKNISSVGCKYTITNPLSYTNNKKTVDITASAEYPSINGAFSKVEANFTVYDPQFSPPSKIVVNVYSYGTGAKSPDDFGPIKVNGTTVNQGQATVFTSGTYSVSEVNDSNYITSYSGNCDSSGNLTLGINDYKTCNIINTIKPQTATLTVIISTNGTMPSSFTFNGVTHSSPLLSQKISIPASSLNSDGTTKDFLIYINSITGYNVSKWAGSVDSLGNSLCFGTYDDGRARIKRGDNIVCAIAFSKQLPPPNTVLMLDRTGSMDPSGVDNYLPDEISAANTLIGALDDYMVKIGVGVFGAPGASEPYNATMIQGLTTTYSALYTAVTNGLATAGGRTNLQSAINTSQSAFPNDGNKRAMVIVSDGVPNRCTTSGCDPNTSALSAATTAKNAGTEIYAIHFGDPTGYDFLASLATNSAVNYTNVSGDTGFLSPSQYNQNSSTDKWTTTVSNNVKYDDGAYDGDTGGHKERYYNFAFPSLTGKTISSVDIKANSWVSGSSGNSSLSPGTAVDDAGTGTRTWSNPTNIRNQDSNFSTTSLSSGQVSHYLKGTNFGFTIPTNAIINGIGVNVTRRASSNSSSNQIVDNVVSLVKSSSIVGNNKAVTGSAWGTSSSGTIVTYGSPTDLWGTTWTATDINNTNFGIVFSAKRSGGSGSSNTASVDYINITVYYTNPATNTACKLGIELSYDGSHWSTQQTQTLNGNVDNVVSFGGTANPWVFSPSHTWTSSDFGNSSSGFIARVQDIDPDSSSNTLCTNGLITNLDILQAKVNYNTRTVDIAGENADGDNFYISPNSTELTQIFKTVSEEILAPTVGQLAPILVVVTQVNNSSGTANKTPSDFTISTNNPTTTTFIDDGTGTILDNLNTGSYSIMPQADPDEKYTFSKSPDCEGTISASETKTCVVIYTANPPPPPPIDMQQNIDINSWHEIPISN